MTAKRPSWQQRNKEAFNEMWRRWYRKNANRKIEWQHRRRLEFRRWYQALKATLECEVCGERSPECLQFHHRDPATKSFTLGNAASSGTYSKARILAEIAKCAVLCGNCHGKHHWEERQK